jgi:hypothetical protein
MTKPSREPTDAELAESEAKYAIAVDRAVAAGDGATPMGRKRIAILRARAARISGERKKLALDVKVRSK